MGLLDNEDTYHMANPPIESADSISLLKFCIARKLSSTNHHIYLGRKMDLSYNGVDLDDKIMSSYESLRVSQVILVE